MVEQGNQTDVFKIGLSANERDDKNFSVADSTSAHQVPPILNAAERPVPSRGEALAALTITPGQMAYELHPLQ